MPDRKPEALRVLVGRRLRELREGFGLSQDQMAARARRWGGLNWTRSALAKIERGERPVTLEEFVILPIVYKNTPLAQLIPKSEGWVSINSQAAVKIEFLGKLLVGRPGIRRLLPQDTDLPELRKVAKQIGLWPDEIGEAERRAARRLNVTPETLAQKARLLWGIGLADERDRRLIEQTSRRSWTELEAATGSRSRGIRGHITRALLRELDEVLTRADRL